MAGVLLQGQGGGVVDAGGQRRRQRGIVLQRLGRAADGLEEIRVADRQLALRRGEVGLRPGQARLRLRHIGTGERAGVELRLGRVRLFLEDFDIVLAQAEDRGVAHHVHVGGRGAEQHGLLGGDELGAGAADLRLGASDLGDGAAAAEDRLGDGDRRLRRMGGDRRERPEHDVAIGVGHALREEVILLIAIGAAGGDRRAPAAIGDRDILIGGAQRGLLGGELRIGLVSDGQRFGERQAGLGRRWRQQRSGVRRGCRRGRLGDMRLVRRRRCGHGNERGQQRRRRDAVVEIHNR
ncbi:MAG: hypothetical protein WDN03_13895 [Rhizomicrobium sp.]